MVRVKSRYLCCSLKLAPSSTFKSTPTITTSILYSNLSALLSTLYGPLITSSLLPSTQILLYDSRSDLLMIRCRLQDYQKVWAALTLLQQVNFPRKSENNNNVKAVVRVRGVCGSGRTARMKAMKQVSSGKGEFVRVQGLVEKTK